MYLQCWKASIPKEKRPYATPWRACCIAPYTWTVSSAAQVSWAVFWLSSSSGPPGNFYSDHTGTYFHYTMSLYYWNCASNARCSCSARRPLANRRNVRLYYWPSRSSNNAFHSLIYPGKYRKENYVKKCCFCVKKCYVVEMFYEKHTKK